MKLRLAGCAAALIALTAVTACGTNVAAGGSAGLSAADRSPNAGVTPAPAPKPTITVAVTPSPLPAGPHTATGGTPATSAPVVIVPIVTKLPVATVADCIAYNPAAVTSVNVGSAGYEITNDIEAMLIVDNATDAQAALALVRSYDKQCFIGRDNTYSGNDRYRHIVDYWTGAGLSGATVPGSDCLHYDNTSLAVNNLGSDGYQVTAGSSALAVLATLADANAVKSLAASHHGLCFIGRDNNRPKHNEYIVEYWL